MNSHHTALREFLSQYKQQNHFQNLSETNFCHTNRKSYTFLLSLVPSPPTSLLQLDKNAGRLMIHIRTRNRMMFLSMTSNRPPTVNSRKSISAIHFLFAFFLPVTWMLGR